MEIQNGGEKMRNASGQQGENERQWKIKANMNTGNKILGKHIRQNSVVVVQNNGKGKTIKRAARAARANLRFAN